MDVQESGNCGVSWMRTVIVQISDTVLRFFGQKPLKP